MSKADSIFEGSKKAEREAKRKEEALEKEMAQRLKTIGQLTLERDFLKDCFRRKGYTVPRIDSQRIGSVRTPSMRAAGDDTLAGLL